MVRSVAFATVLVMLAVVILAGCGGGGGGGAVSPASATLPSSASTQQVFILDFVHHKVSAAVQPQLVERNPGQGAAALALTLIINATTPGSPGQQQITATVKNNTSGAVGVNPQGTVTGLDLCFVSTVFQNAAGGTITGGSYAGYDALNPATGSPFYYLSAVPPPAVKALAAGATTSPRMVDLVLPPGVTTAVVTAIVMTDTQRFNSPDLTHWYLTTLTGHSGTPFYENGSNAEALFDALGFPLYRNGKGDLLVSDYFNGAIRRIHNGQVTTFAGGLEAVSPHNPAGLGQDPAGNVYIADNGDNYGNGNNNGNGSNYKGNTIDIVPAAGGPVTVIAGSYGNPGNNSNCPARSAQFNGPESLAVVGNLIYVCDEGNGEMKLLTYEGTSGLAHPANWWVGDITAGVHFQYPTGVAADASGNVYVVDAGTDKLYVRPLGASGWTVIAGSGTSKEQDGTGLDASFQNAWNIAVDQAGYLYVVDSYASLRRVRHTGGSLTDPTTWVVETLVHSASAPVDGSAGTGRVYKLTGVCCASDGTLYLTEENDIRRLDRTRN